MNSTTSVSAGLDNDVRTLYNKGWRANGEWHCLKCGTMIGKNLLGEQPFLLAWQHIRQCNGKPGNQFKKR